MDWPTSASPDRATPSTAKTGKPHRDLATMRRHRMVPVILHVTNVTTDSALRPPNRVAPGGRGDDLLFEACQQTPPAGYAQSQIGDIVEIIRPADRHDAGEWPFTVGPHFHQPYNPSHASTPGPPTEAKISLWPSHPKTCDSPNWIIAEFNERGIKIVVSQMPRRKQPLNIDREVYKWWHLIENCFCKLKEFKRIAMRGGKTDTSFAAMIYLASAIISLR
jgi:hypothetical protein